MSKELCPEIIVSTVSAVSTPEEVVKSFARTHPGSKSTIHLYRKVPVVLTVLTALTIFPGPVTLN